MSRSDVAIYQGQGLRKSLAQLTEALGREPLPEEKLIFRMGFKNGIAVQADIDQLKLSELELGLATAQRIAVLS